MYSRNAMKLFKYSPYSSISKQYLHSFCGQGTDYILVDNSRGWHMEWKTVWKNPRKGEALSFKRETSTFPKKFSW